MSRIETAEALRSLAEHLTERARQHHGAYADGMDDAAAEAINRADDLDAEPRDPLWDHGVGCQAWAGQPCSCADQSPTA
jgi:hypothetical protein